MFSDLQLEFQELVSSARRLTLTRSAPLSPNIKRGNTSHADPRKREVLGVLPSFIPLIC